MAHRMDMVGMKEWMVDKSLVADRGVDWTFCTVRPLFPPATILPSAHFGFPHTPGVGSIHKCISHVTPNAPCT